MSGLKFAANINWMFTEIPELEGRIGAAKEAGFDAVECTGAYSVSEDILAREMKKHGIKCALLNAYSGETLLDDRTVICNPERVKEFQEKLERSINYAKALDCPILHISSASIQPGDNPVDVENTYISNLKYAAERLQKENILAVVEYINSKYTFPDILVDTPEKAVSIIQKVDHPNLKLQMDLFHLQVMSGDLARNLEKYMPYTAYIQIAQCPGRGEPSSPGEINYDYIFSRLRELGYTGYLGCEYHPAGSTVEGLDWLKKWK